MGNQVAQGTWSRESLLHINVLEMEAVVRAIKHWATDIRGSRVTVLSDSSATVAYVNREGGTRSATLLDKTCELLTLCEVLQVKLRASHLAGKDNTVANALSRGTFRDAEWSI